MGFTTNRNAFWLIISLTTYASNFYTQNSKLNNLINPIFEFTDAHTFCNRAWMASESTMDSLKWVIVKLDRKLSSLPQDSTLNFTDSLVFLYSYEHVVRKDPWGECGHQLCVDESKYGTKAILQKSEKGIKNEVISFDNKYVIVTDTYYYLGNSEIWTTHKKYYIRADKFKTKINSLIID
jgi:hypothetical protein